MFALIENGFTVWGLGWKVSSWGVGGFRAGRLGWRAEVEDGVSIRLRIVFGVWSHVAETKGDVGRREQPYPRSIKSLEDLDQPRAGLGFRVYPGCPL